jgi:hypothetical protein
MANLTPLQEAMNRAHSDNGSTCLPNCWRWHYGNKPMTRKCNWCDADLEIGNTERAIAHNEYHLSNPKSITK